MSTPEMPDRTASLIAQLHGLIALLKSKPGLPLGRFTHADVRYIAGSAAEVDEAARILGVTAAWNEERTQYSAEYATGPNVSYEAHWTTPEHMASYNEHMARWDHTQGGAPA